MLNWRECKGVEPSAHAEGRTPAELKSVRPTGTHPLPRRFVNRKILPRVWGYRGQKKDPGSANTPESSSIRAALQVECLDQAGRYHAFRDGTHDLANWRTVAEHKKCGEASDPVFGSDLRVAIEVQLGEFHFSAEFIGKLFDSGGNDFAGTTPFRPEIHQYRQVGFFNFYTKGGVVHF